MHVDKSSGVNHNQDNIELQQQTHQSQQSSIFSNGFPDKNNNGIVDYEDFNDDTVFEKLKKENLLGSFWGDVYDKVNDIVHFSDKKIEVNTEVLCKTERKDGYEIRIVSANGSQPVLQIQAKDKSVVNIKIDFDEDANNEQKNARLQALINGLKELKTGVLQDLSQEIDKICLSHCIGSSNLVGQCIIPEIIDLAIDKISDDMLPDIITHELGHAIERTTRDRFGLFNNEEYKQAFERFKDLLLVLLKKYNESNNVDKYMIYDFHEDFACRYAKIFGNSELHNADIDNFVKEFEYSNDEEERQCYESHKKLYNLSKEIINNIRQLSREERANVNNKPWRLRCISPEEFYGKTPKQTKSL